MSALAFKNARVVRSGWLEEGGRRLDCNPYMSGALEARDALRILDAPKDKLSDVTSDIFHAGREARVWVDDPRYGVPFLGSTDILAADLTSLPLLSKKQVSRNLRFVLGEHWTLITRSGTIGRMAYVRPDMAGMACSEHVLRVVPDSTKIPPGYLYAFLSSRYGVPLVVSGTYGAIIQHIEPEHIKDIDVPRIGINNERDVHQLIQKSAELRSDFQHRITEATRRLLLYAGIEDCPPHEWIRLGVETGFAARIGISTSMRAANYSPKVSRLLGSIRQVGAVNLADICRNGKLSTGARFKRIDCAPEEGARLIGQKQAFWMRPQGRWIAARYAPPEIFAKNESVLVASSGTLGDAEVYCRPILVTGRWQQFAYSQHFLRIVSGDVRFSGAYLYAFLRSEIAFRAFRSMSTGSKQQEIHVDLAGNLPVPLLDEQKRRDIESLVREAFKLRDEADEAELEAVAAVEKAVSGESLDG